MFLLSRIGVLIYFENEWMNMMVKQATRKNKAAFFVFPAVTSSGWRLLVPKKSLRLRFGFTRLNLDTLDDIWGMDVYGLMYPGSYRTYFCRFYLFLSILSPVIQIIKSNPVHIQFQSYSNVTFINIHDSIVFEMRNCTSLLWQGVISQKTQRSSNWNYSCLKEH